MKKYPEQFGLIMKKYPEQFVESKDFTNVSDEEINELVAKYIYQMENSDDKQHLIFNGNTMILIMKIHPEDGGGIEIIVTKNYQHAYINNKIFK